MKKLSFLERLTGSKSDDDYDKILEDEQSFSEDDEAQELEVAGDEDYQEEVEWSDEESEFNPEEPQEGELPVDMYQTDDYIIIRALVGGITPNELDVSITRDLVTIRGTREEIQETEDENYFHRELFWGSFSRSLPLPEEVILEEAEAQEKHGLLEIRLPKVDKQRSTKLKIKSHTAK